MLKHPPVRELAQWLQQRGHHRSAYLMTTTVTSANCARPASASFILIQFLVVLCETTTWSNNICSHVDDDSTRPSILLQVHFLNFSFVHASLIFRQLMLILDSKQFPNVAKNANLYFYGHLHYSNELSLSILFPIYPKITSHIGGH